MRNFLFLQGPPGPLFRRLGEALAARGHGVFRINLSGGDRLDWRDGAIDYTDRFSQWPTYLDGFLRAHAITDLMLFGDCRAYHLVAQGIAGARGVHIHVLEEGYLRPDWMTLERDGVNARSPLPRDKRWIAEQAAQLPDAQEQPRITASFRRRARDSYWHYHHVVIGRLRFPFYRSHRVGSIIGEGLGWLYKFLRAEPARRRTAQVLAQLADQQYFLLPLQLSGDFQIRTHSHFPDMQSAAAYAIASFAAHADRAMHLVIKSHPLDCSPFNWARFVRRHATTHGVTDRVHFIDGGDLDQLVDGSRGMVCVNSTSATIALAKDKPVKALGKALYDIEGLTHQGHLDGFWTAPQAPEPGLYDAFRKILVSRCLVRGGLASESAVETLMDSIIERLGLGAPAQADTAPAVESDARSTAPAAAPDRPEPARPRGGQRRSAPVRA